MSEQIIVLIELELPQQNKHSCSYNPGLGSSSLNWQPSCQAFSPSTNFSHTQIISISDHFSPVQSVFLFPISFLPLLNTSLASEIIVYIWMWNFQSHQWWSLYSWCQEENHDCHHVSTEKELRLSPSSLINLADSGQRGTEKQKEEKSTSSIKCGGSGELWVHVVISCEWEAAFWLVERAGGQAFCQ